MRENRHRICERRYPQNETIAWGDARGNPLAPARVRDISLSGIGLIIPGDAVVGHGELIRTLSRDHAEARRARVIRVEQHKESGSAETCLGCRWVIGSDRARRYRLRTQERLAVRHTRNALRRLS
ncbi:MAG: PilZ domain-containing protein [Phycisphaeraceae bacterium]|nr:MAG: PilZ domain-containing protein [Phycisphaeraceae bacterium]